MKKINIKLLIYIFLTVSCGIVIFMFSAEDRNTSTTTSLNVLTAIMDFIAKLFNIEVSDIQVRGLHNFFRKTAHFSIYTILSIFSYNTFRLAISQKKYAVLVSFIFCVLMAISDEIHQIFVPGRSAEIRDVCIDTLGVCFGLGLVFIFNVLAHAISKVVKKSKK